MDLITTLWHMTSPLGGSCVVLKCFICKDHENGWSPHTGYGTKKTYLFGQRFDLKDLHQVMIIYKQICAFISYLPLSATSTCVTAGVTHLP